MHIFRSAQGSYMCVGNGGLRSLIFCVDGYIMNLTGDFKAFYFL